MPSGSFFHISSHHWERLAAAPFSHAVFIPAGSGLTVQEPGGFRYPRRWWGERSPRKNCCSPGRSRWRNRSRCRRNCCPGKKRSPPHWKNPPTERKRTPPRWKSCPPERKRIPLRWKSCPRGEWRARRALRWKNSPPGRKRIPRPGPRAAPPWAAATPAGARTW